MKEYGLDLSKHNGSLDFGEIKKKNSFVILRAGYGTSTKDPKFEEYYKKAKAAGLKVGAYWYSYALSVNDAKTEAKKCLEVIKGKQFEYPIYIDMEDADGYKKRNGIPSNSTLVDICNTFCSIVESNGYYVGIYASESWFNNQLKGLNKGRYDVWVANWGTNDGTLQKDKSSVCRLHQFTSNYKIGNKRFDRNISYLDYASVIKENGLNGFNVHATVKPTDRLDTLTDEQVANEIIVGKGGWGDGNIRKEKLGERYNSIQTIVNKKLNVTPKKELKVGSKVAIKKGTKDLNTNKKFLSFVYNTTYTVISVNNNYVVFGKNGVATGKVSKSNVILK